MSHIDLFKKTIYTSVFIDSQFILYDPYEEKLFFWKE